MWLIVPSYIREITFEIFNSSSSWRFSLKFQTTFYTRLAVELSFLTFSNGHFFHEIKFSIYKVQDYIEIQLDSSFSHLWKLEYLIWPVVLPVIEFQFDQIEIRGILLAESKSGYWFLINRTACSPSACNDRSIYLDSKNYSIKTDETTNSKENIRIFF